MHYLFILVPLAGAQVTPWRPVFLLTVKHAHSFFFFFNKKGNARELDLGVHVGRLEKLTLTSKRTSSEAALVFL